VNLPDDLLVNGLRRVELDDDVHGWPFCHRLV
jgi:hypothetical protein